MALQESDIRIDGRPRTGTRPTHPGVIVVAAETRHGPMRWACDTYTDWEANLRAITLTLKNLRLIDNYGCTKRGEQYRGWQALPDKRPAGFPGPMEAALFIRKILGDRVDSIPREQALREAEKLTHPDLGGNADDFKRVQQARAILIP